MQVHRIMSDLRKLHMQLLFLNSERSSLHVRYGYHVQSLCSDLQCAQLPESSELRHIPAMQTSSVTPLPESVCRKSLLLRMAYTDAVISESLSELLLMSRVRHLLPLDLLLHGKYDILQARYTSHRTHPR